MKLKSVTKASFHVHFLFLKKSHSEIIKWYQQFECNSAFEKMETNDFWFPL